jgi:hypothetical protein
MAVRTATDRLRLENGAKVLYYEWVEREPKGGNLPWGVVLAESAGQVQPLVTWVFVQPTVGAEVMNCVWGHYFESTGYGPISAMVDYAVRIEEGGR